MSTRLPHVPSRVLAIVVAPRFSGVAVIDGFGFAEFRGWNIRGHLTLEEKARTLAERAARLVRAHRPGRIVLGVPLREDFRGRLLRAELKKALGRSSVAVSERGARDSRRLLLGRARGHGANALHGAVVRGFFPELADRVRRTREAGAYWRHAFDAAAVAIAELVETYPRTAAALAGPEAFASAALSEALAASDARKYPDVRETPPARTENTVTSGDHAPSAAPMPAAERGAGIARDLRRTTAGPPVSGRPWEGDKQATNYVPVAATART